jgi:hypothetical protein
MDLFLEYILTNDEHEIIKGFFLHKIDNGMHPVFLKRSTR